MNAAVTEQKGKVSRGPLRRIAAIDAIAVREIFTLAMQTIEPEDRTQRQFFAALMPEMYVLRMKGCSFTQLTALLNQSGFNLQLSTVRTYYNEMVAAKMELCEGRMDDQLVVLAKVEEITRGAEISSIAARVAEVKERQKAAVASRVDAVFTQVSVHAQQTQSQTQAQQTEKTEKAAPKAREKTTPPSAATVEARSGDDEGGGFGLLAGAGASADVGTVDVRPGAGFFAMDDAAPQVPVFEKQSKKAKPENTVLRCAKLNSDIEPIEVRSGVPASVYEAGLLEHPAVPGLFLTKEERVYGALLEIIDAHGELRLETLDEKRFRIKWKAPIPVGATESQKNFVQMDSALFGKRPEGAG